MPSWRGAWLTNGRTSKMVPCSERIVSIRLSSHLHLVPRSIHGAIPPLPSTPLWHGAQLKNRDDLTFYLSLCLGFLWLPNKRNLILVLIGPMSQVKLLLCFFKLGTTPWRRIGRVEVYRHAFFSSALDAGEWSASHPGRFTPREIVPGTHCIGSWEVSTISMDTVGKIKIPSPCRDSNPRSSSP
jgi:hypothetical protein